MTVQELIQKKGELATQAQQILDQARSDGRLDLRSEEETKFDAIHVDIEKISGTIARLQKQEALNAGDGRRSEPTQPATETRGDSRLARASRADSFEALRSWFIAGSDQQVTPEQRAAAARAGVNLDQKQIHLYLPTSALRSMDRESVRSWEEARAQSVGSAAGGGFTVPDEAMREIERALLTFGGMRQAATVLRTDSGAALPIPTVNDTAQEGVILGENTTVTQQDAVFNQLVLDAYKYSSKMILVSVELLQDSAVNVASLLGSLLGERIGRVTNRHFTTGTGTAQPNGIVTAATFTQGATGSVTSVSYAQLVDLEHSVDPAYRSGARFMFKDNTLAAIKKLVDSQNRPLWSAGMAVQQPDTILGYPYIINQDMPAMAASAKSILFGDLSKYLIRDVRDITLLRLDERFADFHQVAFLAFSRHDGDLLNAGTNPVKGYQNSAT